jgi:hypothetical protein
MRRKRRRAEYLDPVRYPLAVICGRLLKRVELAIVWLQLLAAPAIGATRDAKLSAS